MVVRSGDVACLEEGGLRAGERFFFTPCSLSFTATRTRGDTAECSCSDVKVCAG